MVVKQPAKEMIVKRAVQQFQNDFETFYAKYVSAISGSEHEAAALLASMMHSKMATDCVELTNFVSIKVMAELKPKLEKAAAKYISKITEASLTSILDTLLKHQIEEFSLKALGLERESFSGKWKIDHCNARMSKLTELIDEEVVTMISSLIQEEIVSWINSPEKQKYISTIKRSIESEIKEQVRQGSYRRVRQVAEEVSNTLFDKAISNVLNSKSLNGGSTEESE